MSDTPPDRLSVDPKSPFYDEAALMRDVGVRFKGVEKTNVMEYCVSEGWARLEVKKGLAFKVNGAVEAYYRLPPQDAAPEG
ncbi:MAG TPA: DUF3297 family protein [Caulobacteraceae bacterium]|jgi:hypothetical protein